MGLWALLGVIAWITKYFPGKYNNFSIFRQSFWHTLNELPLYAAYPEEYNDIFHYGPVFSLVIAPFAITPLWLGLLTWSVAQSLFLFWAVKMLPGIKRERIFIYWFCAHELLTSLFMSQFNISIAAIIVLAYVLIEKEKDVWAAFVIMLGTFTKLYGITGLAFFFFSRHKMKFSLSCVGWAVVMVVAPMILSGPDYIMSQYTGWFEEFDAPLEHGVELPFEEQMRTSVEGTRKILACLARHRVKATFFCTANFALHAKDLILDIQKGGHEIASHGFYHSSFETADLRKSKEALEELTGQPVNGFRMARMMPVEEEEIHKAGYLYNSSLNPTCIPGRYNHLGQPRTYFMKDGVLQLPASVTPIVRFPLFWLAYHNLPATLYRKLALWTWKEDGYFLTYFHPWEFTSLSDRKELKLPFIMTNHSGCGMERRLDALIRFFKDKRAPFGTYTQFSQEILSKSHGQE